MEKRSKKTIFHQLEALLMFSPTVTLSNIFALEWNYLWWKWGEPLFSHILRVSLPKTMKPWEKDGTTKQWGHKRSRVWWLPVHNDDYGVWLIVNKNQHPKVSSLAAWTSWKIREKRGVWAVRSKRENSFMLLPNLPMFIKFRGRGMPWEYDTNAKIFKENDEGLYAGLKIPAIGFDCPWVQAVNGNS